MIRPYPHSPRLAAAAFLALAASAAAFAAGPYELRGVVAGGGGRTLKRPDTALVATLAQPAAANAATGGAHRLVAGFAAPGVAPDRAFCDGFESAPCP